MKPFILLMLSTPNQTKPAYGWVKAGSVPAVPTKLFGALNLETFDWPFVEPTTVDGVSAAHLLAKIEVLDERIIHVIWQCSLPYRAKCPGSGSGWFKSSQLKVKEASCQNSWL